jgi:peptide/nickel transport system substrate-binding protein
MRGRKLGLPLFLAAIVLLAGQALAKEPIELRWAVEMEVSTVEPGQESNNWERVIARNLYDTLVYPDPKTGLKPWIAESWNVSNDALTYTFHLRKGVKFHDGSEILAEDVLFSMQRMLEVGGPTATYFKEVDLENSKVLDDYTVRFKLTEANPAFLPTLMIFGIVNKDLVMAHKAEGDFGEFGDYGKKWLHDHDAGSGPYRATELKHGDYFLMERFEDYSFADWQPNSIDRVRFYIRPEWVTIASMFKKGEVDTVAYSMPVTIQRELKGDERFVWFEEAMPITWFLIMNNKKPPLDDENVRKAISYIFDYDTVINDILAGGVRARGPVPNLFPSWNPDAKMYVRNPQLAKEFIAKSKYTAKELSQFEIDIAAVAGSERFKKIALLASSNLQEIGLKTKIKPMRWTDICQAQVKPETAAGMVVCYQSAKVPHAQEFLVYYTPEGWHTPYPPGGLYYENPKVTELINQAKAAGSIEEQNKFYKEAQALIAEDAPAVFMHYTLRVWPQWRYVQDIPWPTGAVFYETRFDKWTMNTADPLYKKNHP